MASTYTGTPNYTTSIVIPDDGDAAAAASVNPATQSEADMDYFILRAIGQQPTSTSAITLYSIDGSNILVGPISNIIVMENGIYKTLTSAAVTSIGVADLGGGLMAYPANTWLYIYAYSSAGTLKFTIVTTPPDRAKLYQQGTDTYKYIGCFKTDGTPSIIPFYMTRGIYNYLKEIGGGGGNNTMETILTTSTYIPPTSRSGVFNYYADNTGAAGVFNVITIPGTSGWEGLSPAMLGVQGLLELATDETRNLRYKVSLGTITFRLSILGFFE
ncbi:MAG: hypothetical protein EKK57_11050 [Proteobacteria bacterium]|nr:MAG: hypothetical protein EKK57_11050 [Pseudomonadota bacterium]